MLLGTLLLLNLAKAEAELPGVQGTFPVRSQLLVGQSCLAILFALLHQLVEVASMDTAHVQNLLTLSPHLIIIDRRCHF